MNRRQAFVACWLVVVAGCASDGGQRGTGITEAAGNVASVRSTASAGVNGSDVAVDGIDVAVEGTELHTTTDAHGAFTVRGAFAGDTALRFARATDGLAARLPVNAPAGGRLDARDVVLDASTGVATANVVAVGFEGSIVTVACDAGRLSLTSVHRAADDLDTYDVDLDGATLHDAEGHPLPCSELHTGDRLDVQGVYASDGTIGDADLTRR